jgi:hypothetical protein
LVELRKHQRTPFDEQITFHDKGGASFSGSSRDLSLGGMFIQTESPLGFGAPLTITLRVKGTGETFKLPAVSRWTRSDGMGVQFGLLGARETHLIAEMTRDDE